MTFYAAVCLVCGCLALSSASAKAIAPPSAKAPPHLRSDEATEVRYLVAAGTADSLATASLLAHLVETEGEADSRADTGRPDTGRPDTGPPDTGRPDPAPLIARAVSLAPNRAELIWLQLRDCQLRQCAEEQQYAERLHAADPDSGLALLATLNPNRGASPAETTRVITQIGAGRKLDLYWNKSLVMLFDAMTHGKNALPATAITYAADDRLSHATGVLSAIDVPPFKPIITVCASDQFAEPGRRAACERLMTVLDASDSVIAQSLSVSVQQRWSSPGTEKYKTQQTRRLQQEYLVQASARVRGSRVDQDAEARVNLMRSLATEEEVDNAVLTSFHEPLERPAGWQTPPASQ